jgi:hypothetical protein
MAENQKQAVGARRSRRDLTRSSRARKLGRPITSASAPCFLRGYIVDWIRRLPRELFRFEGHVLRWWSKGATKIDSSSHGPWCNANSRPKIQKDVVDLTSCKIRADDVTEGFVSLSSFVTL